MIILLHILLALSIVYGSGFGLVGILQLLIGRKTESIGTGILVPVAGYVVSQLAFSYIYSAISDSKVAAAIVLLGAAVLAVAYLVILKIVANREGSIRQSILPSKADLPVVFSLIAILALSSWAYITIGETHYFHSGNEDFFDGIEGGIAYCSNTPLAVMPEGYRADQRIQYSSQAFWRLSLGVGGVDAFFIQSLLNLILTLTSIYWLVRHVFLGSAKASAVVAFCTVAGAFYFNTFLAGHIGSQMYLSVAPTLLGILLLWGQRRLRPGWLLLGALIFRFITLTYPGPLNFLLVPAVFWIIHERLFKPRNLWPSIADYVGVRIEQGGRFTVDHHRLWRLGVLLMLMAALATGLIFLARVYLEDNKQYQMLLLRTSVSWWICFEKEIFPVFWGLYPSNLVGSNSFFGLFSSNKFVNSSAIAVGAVFSILTVLAAWSFRKREERQYLLLFVLFFPAFYWMMVNFWSSPYYTYKFLYTNFFVIVVSLALWILEVISSTYGWKRYVLAVPFVSLLAVNLFWDTSRCISIYQRPYHQKDKIADFVQHLSREKVSDYSIDIADEVNTLVFSYILQHQWRQVEQLRALSENLVQIEEFNSVAYSTLSNERVIYTNGLLKLVKKRNQNDIDIASRYGTDHIWPLKIAWVGNEVSMLGQSLEKPIQEAVNFIKRSGIQDRTYLDIRAQHIYHLVDHLLRNNQVSLQLDPQKSTCFLRQRFTAFNVVEYVQTQTVFQVTKRDRILFENQFFRVVEVPIDQRTISGAVNQDIGRGGFADMLAQVKLRGARVFLDMPPFEHATLYSRQLLSSNGVQISDGSETDLFLRMSMPPGLENYYYRSICHPKEHVVWQSERNSLRKFFLGLELVEVPRQGRIRLNVTSMDSIRYRYLVAQAGTDFRVSLTNLTPEAKYLRVLAAPGPSIDFSDFHLLLRDADGRALGRWLVSGASTIVTIPLNEETLHSRTSSVLYFEGENLVGHVLMPTEERLLNYGLLAVELTDQAQTYSDEMLRALNIRTTMRYNLLTGSVIADQGYPDIFDEKSKQNLWLGTGWYNFETAGGRRFRWANNDAEFLICNPSTSIRFLCLDVEQGPSLKSDQSIMSVVLADKVLDTFRLKGYCRRRVRLPEQLGRETRIVLHIDKPGMRIKEDPRLLDFRVFRASLSEY